MEVLQTSTYLTAVNTSCHHCGESCEEAKIAIEDKSFCCEGCRMVYDILNSNDLCNYYHLSDNPGISLKGKSLAPYAYLDDPDVVAQVIDFTDGQYVKVSFYLPQIHCASCVWLLENLYKLNAGITASKINFLKKSIYISFDSNLTSLRKITELLASIGYAPELNLNRLSKAAPKAVSKTLYYQLGLAGFTFGNIMLLSFPEYLGLEQESYRQWFGYINIALAIPLLTFCSRDYFQSAWWAIQQRQLNIDMPIALGIVALFGRSVFEILTGVGAGYLDSLAGLIFFLLIGKWFQQKTYYTLSFERDYKSYFPIATSVKTENSVASVPLNKLNVGDIIIIKNQELIPVDGILIQGEASIDYSFVTGESEPVAKGIGEKIFAGGKQIGSALEILVTRKVEQSYLTQLWNNTAFEKEEPRSTKIANLFGRNFTILILVVASATLLYWLPKDWSIAMNAFTAVLIIACPCAVALSIPFTYGNVLRVLAKHQFFIKHINVIDQAQRIANIVFDKTGTITDNEQHHIEYTGKVLSAEDKILIKTLADESAHPLSRALSKYFVSSSTTWKAQEVEEVIGNGIKGSVQARSVRIGSPSFMLDYQNDIEPDQKGVFIEIDNQLKGFFTFSNQYRSFLADTVNALSANFKLFVLSGDNDRERSRLKDIFGASSELLFLQTPQQKLDYIRNLQSRGNSVMMIGDGLNDAGALRQSDVGIVITEDINNFSPACDAILTANQLERLPAFLRYIRQSRYVVYGAYMLAFIYNIIGLSFAVQGTLSPVIAAILMPLSSVTIVVFGVGMSSWLGRKLNK